MWKSAQAMGTSCICVTTLPAPRRASIALKNIETMLRHVLAAPAWHLQTVEGDGEFPAEPCESRPDSGKATHDMYRRMRKALRPPSCRGMHAAHEAPGDSLEAASIAQHLAASNKIDEACSG